jgi:hypothetical protein
MCTPPRIFNRAMITLDCRIIRKTLARKQDLPFAADPFL